MLHLLELFARLLERLLGPALASRCPLEGFLQELGPRGLCRRSGHSRLHRRQQVPSFLVLGKLGLELGQGGGGGRLRLLIA